jgi:hypothetical protein
VLQLSYRGISLAPFAQTVFCGILNGIIWSSRPRYWYYQYCNIYNTVLKHKLNNLCNTYITIWFLHTSAWIRTIPGLLPFFAPQSNIPNEITLDDGSITDNSDIVLNKWKHCFQTLLNLNVDSNSDRIENYRPVSHLKYHKKLYMQMELELYLCTIKGHVDLK